MTPEQKILIEQLLEMGDVRFVKSDASRNKLIVKAISEMDLEQLEILTENYLSEDKREEFLKDIKSKFNKFTENNDTHLIDIVEVVMLMIVIKVLVVIHL